MSLSWVLVLAFVAALAVYLYRRASSTQDLPLPPGPRSLPILGNILDIPVTREYETYTEWAKTYGDVVHVGALGKHFVILNSVEVANELMDGRSSIYSDRPVIPMLHDVRLMDSNLNFIFKRYSPVWRRQRRLFTRHMGPIESRTFFEMHRLSTHTLLRSMLRTPERFVAHFRRQVAEATLAIVYGYQVQPENDSLVAIAEHVLRVVGQGSLPSRFLVNIFPWLKYVPAWFPGAGFKRFAQSCSKAERRFLEEAFEHSKLRIAEGTASPSFVTSALTDESFDDLTVDIKEVALTMYGTAIDTTVSSMQTYILALVLNPSIQARAQAELDTVLGAPTSPTSRLPTFADRPYLPYIDAVVKECLRWIPVAPIGVPHATTEDDEYRGWRIPKDSIVIANAWAMLRDEKTYPDPELFRPERFLGDNPAPHPALRGCFGFGKRECAGRHLAEASLWIQIASILAVFTLSPAKGEDGRDVDVNYARVPAVGLLLHPPAFPCTITPRSKEAEMRIHETKTDGV